MFIVCSLVDVMKELSLMLNVNKDNPINMLKNKKKDPYTYFNIWKILTLKTSGI